MEVLGVGFTFEDMARITGAVGALALSVLTNSNSKEDLNEAMELHMLHRKLLRAMQIADKLNETNDAN